MQCVSTSHHLSCPSDHLPTSTVKNGGRGDPLWSPFVHERINVFFKAHLWEGAGKQRRYAFISQMRLYIIYLAHPVIYQHLRLKMGFRARDCSGNKCAECGVSGGWAGRPRGSHAQPANEPTGGVLILVESPVTCRRRARALIMIKILNAA